MQSKKLPPIHPGRILMEEFLAKGLLTLADAGCVNGHAVSCLAECGIRITDIEESPVKPVGLDFGLKTLAHRFPQRFPVFTIQCNYRFKSPHGVFPRP